MARKKKNDEEQGGLPEWMATYGDMVTLLLTFFILLFSMAQLDKQKFEEVAQSLKSSFIKFESSNKFDINDGDSVMAVYPNPEMIRKMAQDINKYKKEGKTESEAEKNYREFKENIEKTLKEMGLMDKIKVIENAEEIILRVDSVILFDSGKADIKPQGRVTIKKLSEYIKTFKSDITIQGHTDNVPINTVLFPTNWELSTKRATNVTLFLINECGFDPRKLTATGNGEFRPIAPNNTKANRDKNRRIDIVIDK